MQIAVESYNASKTLVENMFNIYMPKTNPKHVVVFLYLANSFGLPDDWWVPYNTAHNRPAVGKEEYITMLSKKGFLDNEEAIKKRYETQITERKLVPWAELRCVIFEFFEMMKVKLAKDAKFLRNKADQLTEMIDRF